MRTDMRTRIYMQQQNPEIPTTPPDVPQPNPQELPGQNPTPDRNEPIVDEGDILLEKFYGMGFRFVYLYGIL